MVLAAGLVKSQSYLYNQKFLPTPNQAAMTNNLKPESYGNRNI